MLLHTENHEPGNREPEDEGLWNVQPETRYDVILRQLRKTHNLKI